MEPPPLPPSLPPPLPAGRAPAPPAPPAKFDLGIPGGLALLACVALIVWANRGNLDWSAEGASRSLGVVVGSLLAFMIFCVGPAWVMWRITRSAIAKNIVLFLMLALVTGANLAVPKLAELRKQRDAMSDLEAESVAYQQAVQRGDAEASPDKVMEKLNALAGGTTPAAMAAGILSQVAQEGTRNVGEYTEAVARFDAVPDASPDDAALYDPNSTTARAAAAAAARQAEYLATIEPKLDALLRAANNPKVANEPLIRGFRTNIRRDVPASIKVFRGLEAQYRSLSDSYGVLKLNHGKWRRSEDGEVKLEDAQAQARYDALLLAADEALESVQAAQAELARLKQQSAQP